MGDIFSDVPMVNYSRSSVSANDQALDYDFELSIINQNLCLQLNTFMFSIKIVITYHGNDR